MRNVAVITRFNYKKDTEEFRWRLKYYQEEVLPRLLQQTHQDFDIWLWCQPKHEELLKSLDSRINTFTGVRSNHSKRSDVALKQGFGIPRYKVQIALDSDDLLKPDAIEQILKHCTGDEPKAVSLQPIMRDARTGKEYQLPSYESRGICSMFYALYQPGKRYLFAYYTNHTKIKRLFKITHIPAGHAYLSVHDYNGSTKIRGHYIEL